MKSILILVLTGVVVAAIWAFQLRSRDSAELAARPQAVAQNLSGQRPAQNIGEAGDLLRRNISGYRGLKFGMAPEEAKKAFPGAQIMIDSPVKIVATIEDRVVFSADFKNGALDMISVQGVNLLAHKEQLVPEYGEPSKTIIMTGPPYSEKSPGTYTYWRGLDGSLVSMCSYGSSGGNPTGEACVLWFAAGRDRLPGPYCN